MTVPGARRHLDTLVSEGLVDVDSRPEGVGRPVNWYRLTDAGRERLDRRYAEFLIRVGDAAERRGVGFERLMMDVADRIARERRQAVTKGPMRDRVRDVAEILRSMGFVVDVSSDGSQMEIIRRDCIVLQLARSHTKAVCESFDTRLLERLLGRKVELVATMGAGDPVCRHRVRVE